MRTDNSFDFVRVESFKGFVSDLKANKELNLFFLQIRELSSEFLRIRLEIGVAVVEEYSKKSKNKDIGGHLVFIMDLVGRYDQDLGKYKFSAE